MRVGTTSDGSRSGLARILLIISGFILLILVSEGIYNVKNKPGVRIPVYLALSRFLAKANNVEASLTYFEKAYDIRLEQLSYDSSQKPGKEKRLPVLPENQKLIYKYKSILENPEINKLINTYNAWGKVLYNLGLSAYKNGEPGLVIPFWQKAIAITPEWSYFHIELANFYLTTENIQRAKETLSYCLEFKYPKEHCQLFLNDNLEKGIFEEVGFLEDTINEEI